MTKSDVLDLLWYNPVEIGHWVGFNDLTEMHNEWLRSFLYKDDDQTLQGHRGSYKTTTLALFFALHTIERPNESVLFFRKTVNDVAEVLRTTSNILKSGCMNKITNVLYGKDLELLVDSSFAISTNLTTRVSGSAQLVGLGIGTSITGKHADIIVTDDIVNVQDRISQAERNRTKLAYMELQNIKNRGGRFINTGTPWHKDDAFTLMPNPVKYDCYSTGLMSEAQIEETKGKMLPSLFAANYELKHIASEDVIFTNPKIGADTALVENGTMHLDSAFYGSDYTAWCVMKKVDGKYYVYGRMLRKHVEDCYGEIMSDYKKFMCTKMHNESNADKGMVGKDLRKLGATVILYHEDMNKFLKIVTYLKAIWNDLYFVEGTDKEFIEQICEYHEDADHDDAPDTVASLARILYGRNTEEYKPIFMGGSRKYENLR
ncbi:MAG TPA: hypothetical protein DHV37_05715 [Erysipelotrichaceae bacterium]|nr:hypothetical protein [Erysipelotrichaceae bacterium]